MKERNNILLAGIMTVVGMLLFISCQEEGLVMMYLMLALART